MRWLGGVPVIRTSSLNQVEQTVNHIRSSERIVLALSPEGTRKKLPAWRTGYYYAAQGAGVPIVPVAFDYSTRTIRIFPAFHLTTDVAGDFAALGSHFRPEMAFRPAQY
jgi:1-acyl-sn-glycerol-3-phosphate acyltransferase